MYIYIITPKVHVSTTFITFIYFCDISKRKKWKKIIFCFLKNLGTPVVRMQKYLKSTSIQKVFDKDTVLVLEYLCFIVKWGKLVKIITSMSNFPLYISPHGDWILVSRWKISRPPVFLPSFFIFFNQIMENSYFPSLFPSLFFHPLNFHPKQSNP